MPLAWPRGRRLPIALCALLLLSLLNCDNKKPVGPAGEPESLALVWGDRQAGVINSVLPADLVVKVGTNEGPGVEGVAVRFEVLSGSVAVPYEVDTDRNGLARARVNLGSTPGDFTIRASSDQLEPVIFQGRSVPPVAVDYQKSISGLNLIWSHTPGEDFRCLSVVRRWETTVVPVRSDTLVLDSTGLETSYLDARPMQARKYCYEFNLSYGDYTVAATSLVVDDSMAVFLNADVTDLVYDPERDCLYAATPTLSSVIVIDPYRFSEIRRIPTFGAPFNVNLSRSGSLLYVPGHAAGRLNIVDIATGATRYIPTDSLADSHYLRDVLEFAPGCLVMISDWLSYQLGTRPLLYWSSPIDTVIRPEYFEPNYCYGGELQLSADSSCVYFVYRRDNRLFIEKFIIVGNSMGSAASRDLRLDGAYPFRFSVSPLTGAIYLTNGLVLDSTDLSTIGTTGITGPLCLSPDGSTLYVVKPGPFPGPTDSLRVYDAVTLEPGNSMPLPYGTKGIWPSPVDPRALLVTAQGRLFAIGVR